MKPDRANDTLPPAETGDATDPGDPPPPDADLSEDAPRDPAYDAGGWDLATTPDAIDVEHLILSLGETRPPPPAREARHRTGAGERRLVAYPSPSPLPALAGSPRGRGQVDPRWGWLWMGGAIVLGLAFFAGVVVLSRPAAPPAQAPAPPPRIRATLPSEVSAAVFNQAAPRSPRLEAPAPPAPPREPARAKRGSGGASPVVSTNASSSKKPVFGEW